MAQSNRVRVSLDRKIYRRLRKYVGAPKDLREWVDQTVKEALSEDIEDSKILKARSKERAIPYEVVRRRLKRDGLL